VEHAAVMTAVERLRTLVQADGGDMELTGVDDATGTVKLRLVLDGVDCHECVMPRPILEDIAGNMLRNAVGGASGVSIEDPRESPDYVPPDAH
jgi:Fe-S cluster biogenesis protein NfuA